MHAPQCLPSCSSADSSEDLLDHLEDFPLVPDTSLVHAITSVPYDDANDSLKNAFLEMGTPVPSATPGSRGTRSFAHEQQVYLDQQSERDGIERYVLRFTCRCLTVLTDCLSLLLPSTLSSVILCTRTFIFHCQASSGFGKHRHAVLQRQTRHTKLRG